MCDFYTLDDLITLKQKGELKQQVIEKTSKLGSSLSFRDVHQYDGKLYIPETPTHNKYDNQTKKELLEKLLLLLSDNNSKNMAYKIMLDCSSDPANNVCPSDILADILSRKISLDIFFLLEEQLADNFCLGQCLQGRTNRLVQIRNMLI